MVMAEVAFSLATRGVSTREDPVPTKLGVPPVPPGCRDDDEVSCRRSLRLVWNFPDLVKTVYDLYRGQPVACNLRVHLRLQGYLLPRLLKT